MPESTLKEQIQSLVELQKIDSQIYALKNQKESKPQEIKALESAFEAKKQRLAELDKSLLDLQKQRKDRELELAANEENRKKLQGQLYSLKTNKEYQAMLQQIADTKADASVIEDKVLQLFEQADKTRVEVEAEKGRLAVEEKSFQAEKQKVQADIKAIDEKIAELDSQRAHITPSIDPRVLAQYEKILQNRAGLAIAGIKDYSCGGCHMTVPPQVVNMVKMYDKMITCEVCNRILYIADES